MKRFISSISHQTFHPAYFKTRFRQSESVSDWPEKFAIITAFATTGETWTDEENEAVDKSLEGELQEAGRWHRRLTGYSPESGHSESGWAVEMALTDACDLGLRYRQDAIYFVSCDELRVILCDDPREHLLIGSFRERLKNR